MIALGRQLCRGLALAGLALAGCCPAVPGELPPAPAALSLRFLGETTFETGTRHAGVEVGGLSGLCYLAPTRTLLALSDDRAARGPARLYRLALALGAEGMRIELEGMVPLTGPDGPFPPGSIDPEGLAAAPGGGLLVSTEGDAEASPRIAPAIYRFDEAGGFAGVQAVGPHFAPNPEGVQRSGVRPNLGLEGLTTAPSGRWVFTTNEQALVQDGPVARGDAGSVVRIVRLDRELRAVAEHAYRTDPPIGGPTDLSVVGVSALTALGDDELLVLERAAAATDGAFRNRIRIYLVSLAGAPSIAGMPSAIAAPGLDKTLVLDLDPLAPRLTPPRLDNYEGMALGPRLPSGERTLLVVSDNNFKDEQRTSFLAFAIAE